MKNNNEILIQYMEDYVKRMKNLSETDPEKVKEEAKEALFRIGIIDENGNLKPPYNGEKVNLDDFERGPGKSIEPEETEKDLFGWKISEETKEHLSKIFEKKLGITCEEFLKLDADEQDKLLAEYRCKLPKVKESSQVMVGYGEHSTFVSVKKGEDTMIRYGNFIESGLTREEEQQRLEDDLDDILYTKPVAFVRKLTRRINTHFKKF